MKYKRLTPEELQSLEKEFIDFLVINGIVADDWEKLKSDKPQNASGLIDSFSDVIYEASMRKIQYLDIVLPKEIMSFYCQPEQIVLVGISTTAKQVDFTQLNDLTQWSGIDADLEIFTRTKSYTKPRELEIFEMVEKGAKPADSQLFNSICLGL